MDADLYFSPKDKSQLLVVLVVFLSSVNGIRDKKNK